MKRAIGCSTAAAGATAMAAGADDCSFVFALPALHADAIAAAKRGMRKRRFMNDSSKL
jgi:hypothetical protein